MKAMKALRVRSVALGALVAVLAGCSGGTTLGGDGTPTCPEGITSCDGVCVDLGADPRNCGECGNACGELEVCSEGACASSCGPGLTDCDGSCRDLSTDRANCGDCGVECGKGLVCSAGDCATFCGPGLTDCSGSCRDLATDRGHCGACDEPCAAGEVCSAGSCELSCQEGLADCSGTCRDLQSDRAHCGECDSPCPPGMVCSAGECDLSCEEGLTDCSGSCRDTETDRANCGRCGAICAAGEICVDGECELSCQEGLTECSGLCVDTDVDERHCGRCGAACGAGELCVDGECELTCPAGLELCGGECVDTDWDPEHCGGCDELCEDVCTRGVCCAGGGGIERYVIPGSQSVCFSYPDAAKWNDNRIRAYTNGATNIIGWVNFDLSGVTPGLITRMTLNLRHEPGFGNPSGGPVTTLYYSTANNWTRAASTMADLPRTQIVAGDTNVFAADAWNAFEVDVDARDFGADVDDGWITLGIDNTNAAYSFVYFYGTDNEATRPYLEIEVDSCE